jgi:hypothetical protein
MKPVLFYAESDAYGEFSNWWPAPIELDGKTWQTTEHYFMAQKTKDEREREQIRKASTPRRAKELGRQVRLRRGWDGMKFEVMLVANRAKFTQHRDLHDLHDLLPPRVIVPSTRAATTRGGEGGHTSRTARTCWARC